MYRFRFSSFRGLLLAMLFFVSSFLIAQKAPKHNNVITLSKNADQNVAILNEYLDALVSGNGAQAGTYLAPDYREYGPSHDAPLNREQALVSWDASSSQRTAQSITDRRTLAWREKSGPQEGEWVMGWGVYHWKDKANGTDIDMPYQITARVNSGQLTEAHYYYDRAAVRDKMGYVSIPAGIDPDAYMIRRVLEAETQAWLDNDGEKMGTYWADLPYAAHTVTDEGGKGYDITATEIGEMVDRLSTQKPNKPGTIFVNTNYNIRPNGHAAWASYEQTFHYPDGRTPVTNLESRYLEKIDGEWKISHMISIPKR
jgi:ketosteroid isomerase-like protein